MIDFHTHILPGIDDGSRDMDMTEQMLAMEAAQGVSDIYATPHFYAHRVTVDKFLERRKRALDATQRLLAAKPDLPNITAGAEVYYFSGMGRAEQLRQLCMEGTDILLLEMPFDQWHSEQLKDLKDIISKQGLRVVLAHVERYIGFQKDRRVWDEIINMPLTIQMNAEPFIVSGLHGRHRQRFCLDMLKNYDNCIIGSDCHNLSDRKPNLAEARRVIEKKIGSGRLTQMDEYTERFLKG